MNDKTPKTMEIIINCEIQIGEQKFTIFGKGSRCKTIERGLERAKKEISQSINERLKSIQEI